MFLRLGGTQLRIRIDVSLLRFSWARSIGWRHFLHQFVSRIRFLRLMDHILRTWKINNGHSLNGNVAPGSKKFCCRYRFHSIQWLFDGFRSSVGVFTILYFRRLEDEFVDGSYASQHSFFAALHPYIYCRVTFFAMVPHWFLSTNVWLYYTVGLRLATKHQFSFSTDHSLPPTIWTWSHNSDSSF